MLLLIGAVLLAAAWGRDGSLTPAAVEKIRSEFKMDAHAMAETARSEGTSMMNRLLSRVLRKHAAEPRDIYGEAGSVRQMRLAKDRMMVAVYRMMVVNLGEPPAEFAWRHRVRQHRRRSDNEHAR